MQPDREPVTQKDRLPAWCAMIAGLLMFAMIPSVALAQWRIGGFLGGEHDSSWEEFMIIGADARFPFSTRNLEFNPRLSYFLREGMTRFQIDANLIKPLVLASNSRIQPYVGVGLAFESVSFENSNIESESNIGYNYVVGGTLRTTGRLQPWAQFQYSVLHEAANTATINIGLHLKMGQPSAAQARRPSPPARR